MNVFISWSGEQSKIVAFALRDWLPVVLQSLKPWCSATDIESGARWSNEIAEQLQNSNFGIVCVTPENLTAPWIFFEAGAVSKAVTSSFVCPYVLGMELTQLVGPLKLFQARKAEKDPTLLLVETLNQQLTPPVPQESLRRLFDAMWPDLATKLETAQKAQTTVPPPQKLEDILDSFVSATRSMEQRLQRIEAVLRVPQSVSAGMQASVKPQEVIEAFSRIPFLKKETIEAGAGDAAYHLARVGIRTKGQLDALVSSDELLKWLADTYVAELLRPAEKPLDPIAVAFWGGLLFNSGFVDGVKQHVISQIRQSPEYAAKHGMGPRFPQ